MDSFDWVDKQEEKRKEERSKEYFDIVEGKQQFVLLSHCAPLAQVFEGGKYRAAVEGEHGSTIRGICWVMQEGMIKQAKLPYTLVKIIRGIQQDPEWEFKIPFPHTFTLDTLNAKTKEVKYTLTPSPKKVVIPEEILLELRKKPKPEEIVERIKGKAPTKTTTSEDTREYPTAESEGIDPNDIPFD